MTAEIQPTNPENLDLHLVEEIFQTKKLIEASIQTIAMNSFCDYNLKFNEQIIRLQAMYGNCFRLYLVEPEETILFEPTPYNNRILEINSTTKTAKDSQNRPKTISYLIDRQRLSKSTFSNGISDTITKPMETAEFENANKLMRRIQNTLNVFLNIRINQSL